MGLHPADLEDLVMLPWPGARSLLGDRAVRVRVLAPPYPAAGVGALRILRVRAFERGAHDGALDVTLGYDGYERLG